MAGFNVSLVSPEWLMSDDCFSDVEELDKILADLPLPDVSSTVQPLSHTCTTTSGQFGTTSQSELQLLQQKNVNSNTKKSTKTWVNHLLKWKDHKGIRGALVHLSEQWLDELLQQFYAEIRKEDGTEYEPDSLRVMLAALDRHFKENGAEYSLLKDKAFERSRLVLNGKAIEL